MKSRAQATRLCQNRNIRINKRPVEKANTPVRVGDILTLAIANRVRVIKVLALGDRRGPAKEAVLLYEDLSAEPAAQSSNSANALKPTPGADRPAGSGRPTKADRRATDRLKGL